MSDSDKQETPLPDSSMLRPGKNCWRIELATKLQFLVDGEDYFSALRAALLRAKYSIYILGWDIDSRVALPRINSSDHFPEALAPFLDALTRSKRELQVYVLSWDYALLFALEREWLPILPLQWRTHRRVNFRLDHRHPVGASHHQKIVVVDDQVAFVGGLDITRCRWDTSLHRPSDPTRHDAEGNPYAPFHDVQAIVEGPVANALGELARCRWERATQRKLTSTKSNSKSSSPNTTAASAWPPQVAPALENIRVAIARTEPSYENYPACFEIRNFYLDAIGAAHKLIFFENQYFSSNAIAQALNNCLQDPDGPTVVAITPQRESGWLEENTMGLLRARLYEQLRANDSGRFHPYSPLLADDSNLNVHSKLMTVDDEWLTIGSANMSNRSMSLDTECNLIIEASTQGERADEIRRAIAHLRNRLLAEHLDCDIATLADMQQQNSLVETIESLRRADNHGRTLIPSEPSTIADTLFTTDSMLIDPEVALKPEHVIANYVAVKDHKSARFHAAIVAAVVILFAVLILLWRETPLRELLNIHTLLDFVESLQRHPLAPLFMLALYVIAGIIFVPVVLLIAATGMVFGPWLGFIYALCGSLLSAATSFWIGSKTGTGLWQYLFRGRAQRLHSHLQAQGLLAVAIVRAMPIAPFTLVNLIAGAARIRWRDFLLGTLTGMLPGITLTMLFVDRAAAAIKRPTLVSIATFVLTMGIIVTVSLLLQHWLRRRKSAQHSTQPEENQSAQPEENHSAQAEENNEQ